MCSFDLKILVWVDAGSLERMHVKNNGDMSSADYIMINLMFFELETTNQLDEATYAGG